jgi:hypothetical protein
VGSTQPREDNWGATWRGEVRRRVWETEINNHEVPLCWPRDTLYPQKLALTSLASGGRSVGIVRLRAKGKEFSFLVYFVESSLREVVMFLCLWFSALSGSRASKIAAGSLWSATCLKFYNINNRLEIWYYYHVYQVCLQYINQRVYVVLKWKRANYSQWTFVKTDYAQSCIVRGLS